jgi:hypothetical protein
VHVTHQRDHRVQHLVRGVDDHVQALVEPVQLGIGDDDRDLDQSIVTQIEPGHLAIDPHQSVRHER